MAARNRSRARGVTAVEAAIVVAVIGSTLAVAIPPFVREFHASRFAEPVQGLERLQAAAMEYAQDRSTETAFPQSAPLTPSSPPQAAQIVDAPGVWETPTWRALHFRPVPDGVPHAYAFGFDSTLSSSQSQFVAHAHGDLDGDGVTSTFEVRGHARPEETAPDPGMYVEAEIE